MGYQELAFSPDASRLLNSIVDEGLKRRVRKRLHDEFGSEMQIGIIDVERIIALLEKPVEPIGDQPTLPAW